MKFLQERIGLVYLTLILVCIVGGIILARLHAPSMFVLVCVVVVSVCGAVLLYTLRNYKER